MKRFLFLVSLVFSLAASAQLATVNVIIPSTSSNLITTTYNVTNAVVGYMVFKAPQNQPTTQDYLVKLDSVSGNHTNVAVAVYGQKFDTSAWVAIGSAINWKGTTRDTIIVFSNATANRYRNYKVQYTGTGTGVTRLTYQQFKLYLE
jgi:hypothetical protein